VIPDRVKALVMKPQSPWRRLGEVLLVSGVVLLACWLAVAGSIPHRTVIDGWGVGPAYDCTDVDPARPCSVLLPIARKALDLRDPGHGQVVNAELHQEGPDASGALVVRSTPLLVAVFKLADGSSKFRQRR
jgi:hypothetical protein